MDIDPRGVEPGEGSDGHPAGDCTERDCVGTTDLSPLPIIHDPAHQARRRRRNIDHIVVGPPGVIVIETKHYAGDVRVQGKELFLKGRRATTFVDQVERQAASLRTVLSVERVERVICVVGGQFGLFGSRTVAGIKLTTQADLLAHIRALPVALDEREIARLARLIDSTLRPAAA